MKRTTWSISFRLALNLISNGDRTKWSLIRFNVMQVITNRTTAQQESDLFITSIVITDRTRRQEVLLPINYKYYNFQEKKNGQVMKEKGNLYWKPNKGGVNYFMSLYTLFLRLLKQTNVIGLLHCPITNCPLITWEVDWWKIIVFIVYMNRYLHFHGIYILEL